MTYRNDDLPICTDDLRVDLLAVELVGLKPVWATANDDYVRSCEILKELDALNLSRCQKQQIVTYVRLQWKDAANKAESMGVFDRQATNGDLSKQLEGLCFTKASKDIDTLDLEIS